MSEPSARERAIQVAKRMGFITVDGTERLCREVEAAILAAEQAAEARGRAAG